MSQWAQAFGALGAVVMVAFGCANWRLPFLERYRLGGFGIGMLTWVLARFDAPAGGPPWWYEAAGSCAMLLAGASGVVRSFRRLRTKDEIEDDGPLRAAEGDAALRHYFKADRTSSLDSAIDNYRAAVRASVGTPALIRHHAHLLRSLRIRYERLRDRADLDEAVHLGRRVRTATGPTTPPSLAADRVEYGAATAPRRHGRLRRPGRGTRVRRGGRRTASTPGTSSFLCAALGSVP